MVQCRKQPATGQKQHCHHRLQYFTGEQPSQFSEALRRLGENAAYLYSAGENYWFSPIASLNQEADDRAKALSAGEVEAEITTLIRAEEKHRGMGFLRVHGAPDDPLGRRGHPA